MDKQAIVIIGNIASGKSTLAQELLLLLPHYSFVSTDDIRRSSGDERLPECEVLDLTIKVISKCESVIFECTGVGKNYQIIKSFLKSKFKVRVILVECPPDVCLKRFYERKQNGYKAFEMTKTADIKTNIYENHIKLQSATKHHGYDSNKITTKEVVNRFFKHFLV